MFSCKKEKEKEITPLTVTVSGSYAYNGATIEPAGANVAVKSGNATLAAADYTLAYSNNTDAGTATVTATGAGNYAGSTGSGSFTIDPCPVSVKADDKSKLAGETDPTLTYTATPPLFGSNTFTGALTRAAGESEGTYAITQGTLAAGSNYAISFTPGVFTIESNDDTVYEIGDTGPGGGIIFYIDRAGFTMTDTGKKAYYLEAAPNEEGVLAWASNAFIPPDYGGTGNWVEIIGSDDIIGSGRKNTALLLAVDPNAPAAKACKAYRGPNNKDDWFLPSKDELNELYKKRNVVGGLTTESYWSSSDHSLMYAGSQDFNTGFDNLNGIQYASRKSFQYGVRSIRAF